MANVNLGGRVSSGGSPFGIVDDSEFRGGYRVVATTASRDAIIDDDKKIGMKICVQSGSSPNLEYRLDATNPDVWTLVTGSGGGGGASVGTTAPLGFSATGSAGSSSFAAPIDHIHPGPVADWPISTVRYFALDYDAGIDTNIGWSDLSGSAAGAFPKKTFEGIQDILPRFGAGRKVELIIKSRTTGSTYRNRAGTLDANLDLRGYSGYSRFLVRGTATSGSASSTAFAGNANDEIYVGAILSLGTNAAGYKITKATGSITGYTLSAPTVVSHSAVLTMTTGERISISGVTDQFTDGSCVNAAVWTVGNVLSPSTFELDGSDSTTFPAFLTGSSSILTRYKVTKADGSAPGFATTESSGSRNRRLRGDSATTTVANRNLVTNVYAHGIDTIIPSGPISPDPNDIWYLEEPGVTFDSCFVGGSDGTDAVSNDLQLVGIRTVSTGTTNFTFGGVNQAILVSFCQARGNFRAQDCVAVAFSNVYFNSANVSRTVGGAKTAVGVVIQNVTDLSMSNFASNAGVTLTTVPVYRLFNSFRASTLTLNRCGTSSTSVNAQGIFNVQSARFLNGITVNNSHGWFENVIFGDASSGVTGINLQGNNTSIVLTSISDQRVDIQAPGLGIYGVENKVLFALRDVFLRGAIAANSSFGFGGEQNSEISLGSSFGLGGTFVGCWLCTDLTLGDAVDRDGNRVLLSSNNVNEDSIIRMDAPTPFYSPNLENIPRFSIVKAFTSASQFVGTGSFVQMAKADTVSGSLGELFIAGNTTFTGSIEGSTVFGHGSNWTWLISDDTPSYNDLLYLSTANAGHCMKTKPSAVGTNQKRRLGRAIKTKVVNGITYVFTRWAPEMLVIDADGEE